MLDMAKLPAVTALSVRGRRVGGFDSEVTAIQEDKCGIGHEFPIVSGHLDYNLTGPFARGAERTVGVEVAGFLNAKAFGVVGGGAEIR